jgi:hypothetical protein
MSKTLMIAMISVLMLGTASSAFAEFDPNMANRYPAYADPIGTAPHATLQSAPVALHKGGNAGNYNGQQSEFSIDLHDRASSPSAGGGF